MEIIYIHIYIYICIYSLDIHIYVYLYACTYHIHARTHFSHPRTQKHPKHTQIQQHTTLHLLCCYLQWPPRHQPWIRAACSYTRSCQLKRQNAAVGSPVSVGGRVVGDTLLQLPILHTHTHTHTTPHSPSHQMH